MKSGSVRKKIIFWYGFPVFILCALTALFLFVLSDRLIVEETREDLTEMTDRAVGILRMMPDGTPAADDSLLQGVGGTCAVICTKDGEVLCGKLPEGFSNEVPFREGRLYRIRQGKHSYCLYDRIFEDLIIRGITPADLKQISPLLCSMSRLFIIAAPLLVAAAVLLGWFITRSAFAPLGDIVDTARRIQEGGDLTRRIGLAQDGGSDEIVRTANVFDQMLDRIQKSFELEQQFTNNVSHELRTPVAVIMSQSEYALEHPEDAAGAAQALENILGQAMKMRKLINRLLFLARADGGRQEIRKEKMDIGLAAEESAAMLETAARRRNISITVDTPEALYIRGDETLIGQMFTNLISNAVKYGKTGGWVKVKIEDGRDVVSIRIEDNGLGIPEEKMEHIWERFYRTSNSMEEGYGLGLPITKWIVEAHGGSIQAVSRPGEGTCFKIILSR